MKNPYYFYICGPSHLHMNKKEPVCIVGGGYLGSQIGLLCAKHGYTVRIQDISKHSLDNSEKSISKYLNEWVDTAEISEMERAKIEKRLSYHIDLKDALFQVSIIIEAISEDLELKRKVFKLIDELCPPDVIIASNSSSIRISKIEDIMSFPERALNMHFYSFPWKRRIVELMRGHSTSDEVMNTAKNFSLNIGVNPLVVLKESTGFIFNRVWRAIKKECLSVVDEGVSSFEDVDRAWMSLYDTDIGPFGLMDRVGLDVVRDIELVYYKESGDPSDAPPAVLLKKIENGALGVKTGKGFYCYPNPRFKSDGWLYGHIS